MFGTRFGGVGAPQIIDFRKIPTFFQFSFFFTLMCFRVCVASWAFLGVSWNPFGALLGVLEPLWAILGFSWDLLWEFLKASWAAKPPRCPQDDPKRPKRLPKAIQEIPQAPPGGHPEAIKGFQEPVQRTPEREMDNSPSQRLTALQTLNVSASSPFSPIVLDFFKLINQVDVL